MTEGFGRFQAVRCFSRADVRGSGYGLGWLAGQGHITCTSIVLSLSLYETALRWFQYAQIHLTQPKKKRKARYTQNTPGYLGGTYSLLSQSLPTNTKAVYSPSSRKKTLHL
jgi:hypothetical protein